MPNLAFERDQLRLADEHLDKLEQHIARTKANIEQQRGHGFDTAVAQDALKAAQESAAVFRDHRKLIAETIADIEAGRLPST